MTFETAVQQGVAISPTAGGAVQRIEFLDANLNFDTSEDLRENLKREVARHLLDGQRAFLADLNRVELIDSSGIGTVIAIHHQVAAAGGTLAVIGVRPFVSKVLRMMRLDRFLNTCPDEDRALRLLID